MNEKCKGCTLVSDVRPCFVKTFNGEDGCPCTTCLVKVICCKDCDTFNEYADNLQENERMKQNVK